MTEEPGSREPPPVRVPGAKGGPQNVQAESDARPHELPPRGFPVPAAVESQAPFGNRDRTVISPVELAKPPPVTRPVTRHGVRPGMNGAAGV